MRGPGPEPLPVGSGPFRRREPAHTHVAGHYRPTVRRRAGAIDTGQARLILREFPLDGLAVAAFMLARCAGPDRYYPMVGALFDTQETWAVPGADGKEKLLLIAKQAGFSKEKFDQCVADKELFQKIVDTRTRANEEFGVDSTPSFFVNGKRLTGEHTLQDFETALGGGKAPAEGAASPAGETPDKPESTTGQ